MKRLFFILLVSFSMSTLYSQDNLFFGLKASYLIPDFSWNYIPGPDDSTNGVTLGALLEYKIKEKVSLQGEALYSVYSLDISDNTWHNFAYLEIPVLIKYYLIKNLNIHGGLKFAFNLDSNGSDIYNNKDKVSSVNILFPMGLEYKFDFGLAANIRYNIGLSNVNTENYIQWVDYISAFEMGLAYYF